MKTHSPAVIQNWCMKFHFHVKAFGVHTHNCFDFCPSPGNSKGFTCGDDTIVQQCDVPLLLKPKLCLWLSLIHAALQDVFPLAGTNKHQIVQKQHGQGCEALFHLIRTTHPAHHPHPMAQMQDCPEQLDKQSIVDFFNTFLQFPHLQAFIEDVSLNLNDPCKWEGFILSLKRGGDLLNLMCKDCHSINQAKLARHQQGNLVSTLKEARQRLPALS